jgi:two-component system, NarL family, sensor histidine kinase UhpB
MRKFAEFDVAHLRSLALAIIIVQALYWLIAFPSLNQLPSFEGVSRFETVDVASLPAPTRAALEAARFETVEAPWSDCCSAGYRAVRYRFALLTVPVHGLLIAEPGEGDNRHIYVNGNFLSGTGRMNARHPTFQANLRGFLHIPPSMLRIGDNRIEVILVRSAMPWFDAGSMVYGDADRFDSSFESRRFALNDFELFSIGVGFAICLLAMFFALRSQERALPAWMALLLAAWVLNAAFYRWVDPPFSPTLRLVYYFALVTVVPVCWFGLVTAWIRLRPRWPIIVVGTIWACVIASIAWLAFSGRGSWFDEASLIADYFRLPTIILTVGLFLTAFIRKPAVGNAWEAAILILCMVLLGADAFWELRWQRPLGQMQISLVFFMIALAAAFIARNIRLFKSSETLNAMLSGQLAERTIMLEAAHARETAVVRAQAHLNERQRIMRDMHDGLGSQLMSMLLAAKRGQADAPTMATGLQSVIDEMRLMLDSMDSVGESLASALAIFRDRVSGQVDAAGFDLQWSDHSEGALPDFGPREVLQIFRVLQEAVANALRHSGGKVVAVNIEPSPVADMALRVTVRDDGNGMDGHAANPRGRGVANMQARTQNIGGALTLSSSLTGTSVIIDLPDVDRSADG